MTLQLTRTEHVTGKIVYAFETHVGYGGENDTYVGLSVARPLMLDQPVVEWARRYTLGDIITLFALTAEADTYTR